MVAFETLRKANSLIRECGVENPPVDIYKIAVRQGIREVRLESMSLDGELKKLKHGGYIVVLNRNIGETRRRFTLAHEIAHTLLLEQNTPTERIGKNSPSIREEEICNLVAAELLIPDHLIRKKVLDTSKFRIRTLISLAGAFNCSLEAAALKLLNTTAIRGVLLVWTVVKEPSGTYLRLVANPRTLDLHIPFPRGLRVLPGTPNWEQLVSTEPEMVTLQLQDEGASYLAERVRFSPRRILSLIKIPQSGKPDTMKRATSGQRNLFDQLG